MSAAVQEWPFSSIQAASSASCIFEEIDPSLKISPFCLFLQNKMVFFFFYFYLCCLSGEEESMFERTNFIIVIYFILQALSGESENLLICYLIRTRRLFLRPQK